MVILDGVLKNGYTREEMKEMGMELTSASSSLGIRYSVLAIHTDEFVESVNGDYYKQKTFGWGGWSELENDVWVYSKKAVDSTFVFITLMGYSFNLETKRWSK